MADQHAYEKMFVTRTIITTHDDQRGIIILDLIITIIWREEQIFQDVHRQNTAPIPTLYGAPVPHPGQTRPLFEERLSHGMSALSQTTRANRPVSARDDGSTPSNSHTIPNQGYQANAAAILARLRAQGVEINNTPRHFDFARDLARLRAVNQPSAHNDAPLVSQTPS